MLAQKLLQHRNISNSRLSYLLKKYSKQATASGIEHYERTRFAPQKEKEPKTGSFIINLLLGQVNDATLMYPEVLSRDRWKDFFSWLQPIENYILNCADTDKKLNREEILNNLREYELFQAHMEEDYGLNLSATESLKLTETVSTLPWLGTYLVKNNILPVKILSKYGSESQKKEYYPKIMNREIVPTICINEGGNGTNINNIRSFAFPNEGSTWVLNGEKTFVVNGVNSNLYLVFARSVPIDSFRSKPDAFSLFLVEKDDTVTCTEVYDTIGRYEIPTCKVSFKDTVVPSKNVIGEPNTAFNILMELLKPGEQNIAAQAITILKNFTDKLIPDILESKHFDRDLYQYDYVKSTLGKMVFALYNMESMAYFTSGLIDQYENQDTSIEKVITEKYCADQCLKCIEEGMRLMGAHSYLTDALYIQSFHDALALTTLDMNNMDANTYVGSAILKAVGNMFHEHVYKKRNYVQFPIYNIIDTLLNKSEVKISFIEYFHPSLKVGSDHLGEGVKQFRRCLDILLHSNGSEIMEQYNSFERITEMITEIYAAVASLSRSSRSYSIGIQNAETEKYIGTTTSYMMRENISAMVQQLELESLSLLDNSHRLASELAYEKRRYCIQHPLSRTLF